MIHGKYTPLANAIPQHWPCTTVDILPIIMSRTHTPHTFTIVGLTSQLTLRTDPLRQTCLENTTRQHTNPNTTPLAHCPMAAPSTSYLSHPIPHDHTSHFHLPHPHMPLTASYHPHARHTPLGGSKPPQHPLERPGFGGCSQFYPRGKSAHIAYRCVGSCTWSKCTRPKLCSQVSYMAEQLMSVKQQPVQFVGIVVNQF
jgi:hypothetical protein